MKGEPFPDSAPFSVGFISLGCARNLIDSQVLADHLLSAGIPLAPSPEEADVIIVNTCAFIEEARRESAEAVLSACQAKRDGLCRAVIVAGCMTQRYAETITERFPCVDAFIGVDELEKIPDVAAAVVSGKSGIVRVSDIPGKLYEPALPGVVFSRGRYAYLRISAGCHHSCSFCAIPGIRGRYRSRPQNSIVAEAESLLEEGYRELDLIAEDTTAYGIDLSGGANLAGLIRAIGALGGKFWLRVLYGYPTGITAELLEAMAEVPQACCYLDVPIQHSHPDMLKAMNRGRTAKAVHGMVQKARETLPGAVLRTTCLVGFPGETEEHFAHLRDYVRSTGFDHLGVFTFSPEKGTPAFELGNIPSPETAANRREDLLLVQEEVIDRKTSELAGGTTEVLLEKKDETADNIMHGRDRRLAPEVDGEVTVTGLPGNLREGDFAAARYCGRDGYNMRAEFVCG
ncbi:MAG: 30S ribosomal protein S12 methylthiotransferase RimO [Kiritimatiellia bacterium]